MTSSDQNILHPEELASLTQAPEGKFVLPTEAGDLVCSKSLRFLPGKRLVVDAQWKGRHVVAKCFFGAHALRDQQREVSGIKGFQKSGIQTPELIHQSGSQTFAIVITACLDPVASFEDIWNGELSDNDRKKWLIHIAGMMAAMHKAGVQQADIHLDNLLMHNNQLYLIDGGGAKVSNEPLSGKDALDNLSLFHAVLYPKFDSLLEDTWKAYSTHAPEITRHHSLQSFSDQVQKQRKWREKYILKALRNCTRFRVEKSWQRFISVDREFDNSALQPLLQNPEQVIAKNQIIKKGRTNTVAIVSLENGKKVLVKRYKSTKGILHKYLRCLTKSRARISWLNGLLLEMLGITTPQPVAMIEERFGPVVLCSYIVTDFVPGTQAIKWFPDNSSRPEASGMAAKVADIIKTLQRSLIFHGDMKATNILLVNGQPVLIDLDAMRSYKDPAKFRQAAEIDRKRFHRNWEGHPEVQQLFEPYLSKE